MGGIGSGRRRTTHTGMVEDALALDIRVLRRLGVVRPGECVCDTVRWSQHGLNVSYARLRSDLSADVHGVMTIEGVVGGYAVKQRIAIEAVQAGFGGSRLYFLCPATGTRCEILYHDGDRFAGRKALGLGYLSQGLDGLSRARRRVRKLRRRLKGEGTLARPRGGNRIDLVLRLQDAEHHAGELYRDRLRNLIDRSATQRIPGKTH